MTKRYEREELTLAYARHLFDEFGVECGLYHKASDLDLNFEDFDECIRNTPEDQLNTDYYRYTIADFVEEYFSENYRVELFHWVNGSGFSCNETFDHLDEYCTAEEYVKSLDTSPEDLIRDDATKVVVFDKDDNELSSYWINKED